MTTTAETPIPSLDIYNARMAQSLIDKIYFMDKVEDVRVYVDFGCADGVMIKALAKFFPDFVYIGYDVLPEMISKAQENNPHGVFFTSDWAEVQRMVRETGGKSAIILSSIIHEVYSYCGEREIDEFWERVFNSSFDYVIVREMMVGRSATRMSDSISVARIRQIFDSRKLQQWESRWGSITENWSLVHLLLTYRYVEGWEREYMENYLPVNLEDFLPKVPARYFPTFFEHYTLPFIRNQVERDFGVQLQDRTHVKMILELRK